MARPPETVTVKDILDFVGDSDTQDDDKKNAGPAVDILLRRDQAVQNALDGITLKSLVPFQDQALSCGGKRKPSKIKS